MSRRWMMLLSGVLLVAVVTTIGRAQTGPSHAQLEPAHAQLELGEIPEPLRPWADWATWHELHRNCPTPYDSAKEHICHWPSRMSLTAEPQRGSWQVTVTVFEPTWVPLPGNAEVWPMNVRSGDELLVVVEHGGVPAVQLKAGKHELTGEFRWDVMPQRVAIPIEIGLLSLTVGGKAVAIPIWDVHGDVWLQRLRAEEADQDLLSVQVYRVLEDGIPLWLRTEIELTVSGKSREEDLGWILPEGWRLSLIDSPIPVAVDDTGRMKAQVRAGKWTIAAHAFRTDDVREFGYAADAQPISDMDLIGFQANPEFRMAEFVGLSAIDVTQTTFPEKWRHLPVYQWTTNAPFQLVEKMRGMGLERPAGLQVTRRFWLDEDGGGITYHDQVQGAMQQIWRLDVAEGQQLGAVRIDGKGQLITTNPQTGAHGFEIRTRNLNLEAVGRTERTSQWSATGWQTDVDSLNLTLTLPPGWRVLALFGADEVEGDWLTAWSLLDLFLLLIFTLAVFRLWGFFAGIIAFLAFGLAYHEIGAPRFSWLFLLMPLALLRVVPDGIARRLVTVWKYVAAAILLLFLVPFVVMHVQAAIYPQLEPQGFSYSPRSLFGRLAVRRQADFNFDVQAQAPFSLGLEAAANGSVEFVEGAENSMAAKQVQSRFTTSNLAYDPQAKIQTGPAQPEWSWNEVRCVWNGPVSADQRIRPILISTTLHRILTVVRIALLLALAGIVLSVRGIRNPFGKRTASSAALLLVLSLTNSASAQFPDATLLNDLRERLLQTSDAFPHAAEITSVDLKVAAGKLELQAEIHAAADVAVPLPGRLPAWSPVSVLLDGKPDTVVRRRDGYLWISLPPGVHRVNVVGMLPDTMEWEWTYLLAPRRVKIDAADWTVTGLRPNGVPEQQIFFVRKQQAAEGTVAYDRRDFQAVVVVDRHLEIGLIWQVRTVVTRLSSPGKAINLRIPLLANESVLTSSIVVNEGLADVRLAAGETSIEWQSELPIGNNIQLTSAASDQWVERWHLLTSPTWNVAPAGLPPIFEAQEANLIPVWHPWPGESASLTLSQPEAISGATVTVQHVQHETTLGSRQRASQLNLDVECSLGTDFRIDLDATAEISSLTRGGETMRVRRDGSALIVPLQPGKQRVEVAWRTYDTMQTALGIGQVTLPVESANITSVVHVPNSRWILWVAGPLRGPAVRFWPILVCAILAGLVLGRLADSPLRHIEWVLLAIGLTQVNLIAAFVVVGWLFLLALRGRTDPSRIKTWRFNLWQLFLIVHTLATLIILIFVVREGLLGDPKMFIVGNGSTRSDLIWFQPRAGTALPEPRVISISVWFYRGLMLLWALWLAAALLRWLKWGWTQFSQGGYWKRTAKIVAVSS